MNTIPTTFNQIFDQQLADNSIINGIEIPIIQRDYAQGRETIEVNRIRNQFINVLHNALLGDKQSAVKLDFIYGNVEDGKLVPLDGQQRLTTLFLLYWYIAKHENIAEEKQTFLANFTYKTRFSSQHFCNQLVKCKPDFNSDKISEWIKDQNWFMYSWEKDPTIKSMLVMIDKIHDTFQDETDLWKKLTQSENPPISFYFLALDEMGVTDSLYIKMNSRGKPLTEFEHFKAEFEKIIKSISKDLYKEFIDKVDVAWVDMLWKYRDEKNSTDDKFMKYYRYITEMMCYEQEVQIVENDFDLALLVYGKENSLAEENLKFLFKSFDCWLEIKDIDAFFDSIFTKSSYVDKKVRIYSEKKNLFALCCHNYNELVNRRRQFSLNNTILLYGIVKYLVNQETISESQFIERLRIIRNLVMNSQFEIRETRLAGLLEDALKISLNGEIISGTKGFNEFQKSEEIEKITWRTNNSNLTSKLNELEDHSLLQGSISIIGLSDVDVFSQRVSAFVNLFNSDVNYDKIRQALLVIGDYSQLASWRYLFGNNNELSWRELFTPSIKKKRFENTHDILMILIDNFLSDTGNSLDDIIEKYLSNENQLKDWRYYLIKYSKMRSGNSGVYYWYNDNDHVKENPYEMYMMNTSLSLGGKHWNPFLYEIKNDVEFSKLLSIDDYYSPLTIKKTNDTIICKNDRWQILNSQGEEINSILIPQKEGIDTQDRIDIMKEYLRSMFN